MIALDADVEFQLLIIAGRRGEGHGLDRHGCIAGGGFARVVLIKQFWLRI